ncbi:MAG: Formamidopyrimidine-DNA glycosylase [Candidatus Pacebacteria bacterium GW2011_GWB1_47_8]|nr:MAG: Formamidopyrimidine-DNA glycosylase [Candidatus Pacebacteria bacterium GW2011_GWA1_46_10]KKU84492.1 MAG: Formamidopyrimidine-DNA glycosylase [Candidatus Pacebacteria bacterium GW2011_GWB1_47_8]HCR81441.1 DNA-formamidopyrimidine glycosylase [Candidatus Paceibacterota bacterium]
MPELPEVETVARRLAQVLPGRTIKSVKVLRNKSFQGKPVWLSGKKIENVSRRAKMIRLHITGKRDMLIHLKMTGQLIFMNGEKKIGGGHPTGDWTNDLPSKHTRVIVEFTDKSTLFFNDMRVFGWLKLVDDAQLAVEYGKYGPDVNIEEVTVEYFKKVFANRKMPIKLALMNNSVLSGVGNIYANEALFIARVHPARPANSLTSKEWKNVFQATKKVIDDGIKAGGTTFDGKFVDVSGLAGKYQEKLKVYGRAGKSCPRCGTIIQKMKIGGRGTQYCPHCQK